MGGVTRPAAARMIAEDLHPRGAVERAFAFGARYAPGKLRWIFYRKLKRRLQRRAEARFADLAAALGPGDIALDLGANVGEITDMLLAGGAQVHAFEPEPESFGILLERFGDLVNVHLTEAAVADYDGEADLVLPASFAENPRSASKAASIAHDRYRAEGSTRTIRVCDIRGVLASLPARPALIKMDIEGAELAVLEALRAADALGPETAVFVETHERLDLSTLPRVQALQAWARGDGTEAARAYVNLYWG